jgi:hypothetical protein
MVKARDFPLKGSALNDAFHHPSRCLGHLTPPMTQSVFLFKNGSK